MFSRTQNKVSYNDDEACNYLLESDEEDLGQLEHTKDGGSSTDSEYNNDDNQLQLTSPSLKLTRMPRCQASGICCTGGETKVRKKCWFCNAP